MTRTRTDETPDEVMRRREQHLRRAQTQDRVRATLARMNERGWPNRWPRELLITHKGRD